MLRALLRLLVASGGAAAATLLVAALESRAVTAATEGRLPLGTLLFAELGVLFPVTLGVGGGVGIFALLADPGEPTSVIGLFGWAKRAAILDRLRAATLAPIVVLGAFAWCLGTAHMARAGLGAGSPSESGLSVGLGAVALLAFVALVGLACAPLLRKGLAFAGGSVPQLVDPALTGAAALVLALALLALGVRLGDTSGDGGGVLGVFGVLKREELDLRPVANLAVLALGAWLAPTAFARSGFVAEAGKVRSGPVIAALAGVGMLVALGVLCGLASGSLNAAPLVTRGLERSAPLAKISLAALRRATDRDKDGYSARFGGGDCNDKDPLINPAANDIPGNGIDEDCSGEDTAPVAPPPPEPAADAGTARGPRRSYNVILITIDTLRPDLGFMGYEHPVSPNLDKIAAKATVFERAYSMASYTGKSVGPMLIGKYPSETDTNFSHFNTYAPSNVFVTERVHDAGARTFGVMCHFYFKLPTGLNQGMDIWDSSAMPPGMKDKDNSITSDRMSDVALKLLADPDNVSPPPLAAAEDAGASGAETDDAGAAVLADAGAQAGPRRFFAWLHYFDPHAAYVSHQGAPDFSGSKAPFASSRVLYDEEVWFTDKHIGRVLDYVASQPWGEDTAIVLTADHGEAFYEHGMLFHGSEIWEELVRVPLFVYVPGAEPRRVSVKRSHIDLAPTILDLMGLWPVETDSFHGKSLLDDVYLEKGKEHEERDVYVDMPEGPYNAVRRAIITGPTPGMKLIHSGGASYQLFDLAEDPAEKKDLSSDKERLAPVLARLSAMRARVKDVAPKK